MGYSTQKRTWIIRYFEQNPDKEICVNDIHRFLLENDIQTNITTIYRYLEQLVEQGTVLKSVNGMKEMATFRYMNGKQGCCDHLHLKCLKCGKIQHRDCGFMDEIARHIGLEHGFVIDCKASYLAGLCNDCRQ